MYYIELSTLQYPLTEFDIKQKYPNTSFPDNFVALQDYAPVNPTPQPSCDPNYQKIIQTQPELIDGKWYEVWRVVDLSDDEKNQVSEMKKNEIRSERYMKLLHSDWTQLPDAPVDKQAWATYRQALRDVTSQPGFPFDVIWPPAPTN